MGSPWSRLGFPAPPQAEPAPEPYNLYNAEPVPQPDLNEPAALGEPPGRSDGDVDFGEPGRSDGDVDFGEPEPPSSPPPPPPPRDEFRLDDSIEVQRALHTHAVLRAFLHPTAAHDAETIEDCAQPQFVDQLARLYKSHGPAHPFLQAWLPKVTSDPMRALWGALCEAGPFRVIHLDDIMRHAAAVDDEQVQHAVHRFIAAVFSASIAIRSLILMDARVIQVQLEVALSGRLLPELIGPEMDDKPGFLGQDLQLNPAFSDQRWVHTMFAASLDPQMAQVLKDLCSDIAALFRKYWQPVSVEALVDAVHMWRARVPKGYCLPCIVATLTSTVAQSRDGGFQQCTRLVGKPYDTQWVLRVLQEPYTQAFNEPFLRAFEQRAASSSLHWKPFMVAMVRCVLRSPTADPSRVKMWKACLVEVVESALRKGFLTVDKGYAKMVNSLLTACETDGILPIQPRQHAVFEAWFASQRDGKAPDYHDYSDMLRQHSANIARIHEPQDRMVFTSASSKLKFAMIEVRRRAGAVVIVTGHSTRRGTLVGQRHKSLWDFHKDPVVVPPKTAAGRRVVHMRARAHTEFRTIARCPDVFVRQVGGQCYLGAMMNVLLGHPLLRYMFVGYAEHASEAVFEALLSGVGISRTLGANFSAMLQMTMVRQAMRGSDDQPDPAMSDTLTELEAAARGGSTRGVGGTVCRLIDPFLLHLGQFRTTDDPMAFADHEFMVGPRLLPEEPLRTMQLEYSPNWHFVGGILGVPQHVVALVRCSNQPSKAFIVDSAVGDTVRVDWDSTTPASLGLQYAYGVYIATRFIDTLLDKAGAATVFAALEHAFLNGQLRSARGKEDLL